MSDEKSKNSNSRMDVPDVPSGLVFALIESLVDGVAFFDTEMKVILTNAALMKITGLPKRGFNLSELTQLLTSEDIDLDVRITKALSVTDSVRVDEVAVSRFVYELYVVPVTDSIGRLSGGAIILHDITEMKEMDTLRNDFMNVAAHDLRTPITAVKGFVQMIRQGDFGDPPKGEMRARAVIASAPPPPTLRKDLFNKAGKDAKTTSHHTRKFTADSDMIQEHYPQIWLQCGGKYLTFFQALRGIGCKSLTRRKVNLVMGLQVRIERSVPIVINFMRTTSREDFTSPGRLTINTVILKGFHDPIVIHGRLEVPSILSLHVLGMDGPTYPHLPKLEVDTKYYDEMRQRRSSQIARAKEMTTPAREIEGVGSSFDTTMGFYDVDG